MRIALELRVLNVGRSTDFMLDRTCDKHRTRVMEPFEANLE
jgi:hypothetical protein